MATKVVILGGGFAGMNVARAFESRARHGEVDVTIVNRENYSLFTPMLPEVASGSIEARHIAVPLRSVLARTKFDLGEVTAVDMQARTVSLRRPLSETSATLPFDQLIVALGGESSTLGIPGAAEHTYPLKTLPDALAVRSAALTALENGASVEDDVERRPFTTFVIVGGGFTGVEAAGELRSFLDGAVRFYPHIEKSDIRVVLIAGGDGLLAQLPQRLGFRARELLERRDIEIVFDDHVACVDEDGIVLASGTRYSSRCVVWSAGIRPASLVATIGLPLSKHKAIAVDADLSVRDAAGVWALGDCAQIPKPRGGNYEQTAQHAIHEASHVVRNVLATLRGRPTRPYTFRALGMMASLGSRQGLALIGDRLTLEGFPAYLLWRLYYLTQLPKLDRKARVAIDWLLAMRYPEDIASVR